MPSPIIQKEANEMEANAKGGTKQRKEEIFVLVLEFIKKIANPEGIIVLETPLNTYPNTSWKIKQTYQENNNRISLLGLYHNKENSFILKDDGIAFCIYHVEVDFYVKPQYEKFVYAFRYNITSL
jgi:hypothetical protein